MYGRLKHTSVKTLRWSEQYLKTDMVYLASGGFWLTLGQAISSLSSLALAVAFANLLPPEVYGVYRYVLSLAVLFAIPTLSGINTSLIQAVARGMDGTYQEALGTKMRWGLLGGMLSLGTAGYYLLQGNTDIGISLLIAAIFMPYMDSFSLYDSVFQGKKDFRRSAVYFIYSQLFAVASLITAIALTHNLFAVVFAYFASWTLARFLCHLRVKHLYALSGGHDSESIPYGKHLTVINIINVVATNIDRLLIFHFLGAVQLAVYSFAIAMPEQIKGALKGASSLALPKFATSEPGKISQKALWRKTVLLSCGIAAVVALYIAAAPYLFAILFPAYLSAVFYSQLYALTLLGAAAIIPLALLQAHGKKEALYSINTYSSVAQIVALVLLTYLFGIMGAVISRVCARIVTFALVAWFTAQEYNVTRS